MWPVKKPVYTAKDSWEKCTSLSRNTVKNDDLGTKLRNSANVAEEAASAFRAAAESRTLHDLKPERFTVPGVSGESVTNIVYTSGMSRSGAPGRAIYDALMAAPEDELCPLCHHTEVSQLDHVMPKATYPALCVAPENLVAVCGICNHIKSSKASSEAGMVLLHPYFENASAGSWLDARVASGSNGRLEYFVSEPSYWDPVFTDRVRHQFGLLEVGERYTKKANTALNPLRRHFGNILKSGGPSAVRKALDDLAVSHLEYDPNHWLGVAYRAWSSNWEFCLGGFQLSFQGSGPNESG